MLILLTALFYGYWYFNCLDSQITGFIRDDGMYVISAKALAQGQGYHLIHLVTGPAHIKYPILYPLFLSAGWILNPVFPDNLLSLGTITFSFLLFSYIFLFYYLQEIKKVPLWLAWGIVVLVASNFFTICNATSLMSESPYLLFSLLSIYYAEKKLSQEISPQSIWTAAFLSALTFHTRTIGLLLIASIALWLYCQKKRKAALGYLAASLALTALPWLLWQKLNASPPLPADLFAVDYPFKNYTAEFSTLLNGPLYITMVKNCTALFISSLTTVMFPVVSNYFALYPSQLNGLSPAIIRAYLIFELLFSFALVGFYFLQGVGFLRRCIFNRTTLERVSIPALYLTLYCLTIILWGSENQMARFISVLLPWLWLYLFYPLLQNRNRVKTGIIIFLMMLSLWPVAQGYHYLQRMHREHFVEYNGHPFLWEDYQDTFQFIQKNLPPNSPIGALSESVVYLNTGHPTYLVDFLVMPPQTGTLEEKNIKRLMKSLDHYHIEYLLMEPYLKGFQMINDKNPLILLLMDRYPERFREVYRTQSGALSVYQILPARVNPQTGKTLPDKNPVSP